MEENHAVRRFRLLAEGKPDIGREPPKDHAAMDQIDEMIRNFMGDPFGSGFDDLMKSAKKKTERN